VYHSRQSQISEQRNRHTIGTVMGLDEITKSSINKHWKRTPTKPGE